MKNNSSIILDKRNSKEINFTTAKNFNFLVEQFPYQKINLLDIKDKKIIDYKTKSRNISNKLFKSASTGVIPPSSKINIRNKILEMKPHLIQQLIASHLNITNNKISENFYKNIYNKFNIDNRIEYVERRNNLFTKSLSKTKNALKKFELLKEI